MKGQRKDVKAIIEKRRKEGVPSRYNIGIEDMTEVMNLSGGDVFSAMSDMFLLGFELGSLAEKATDRRRDNANFKQTLGNIGQRI